MIWSISWKNVWRNKLRSLVVVIAVTLGLFAGVFSCALMDGWVKQRIRSVINIEVAHIQVHNPKYLDNKEMKYYIENADELVTSIEKIPEVKSVCRRLKVAAMASTAASGTGVTVYGINPEIEKQVSELYKAVKDSAGTYFESSGKNPIVIGEKLAKKLKLIQYKLTEEDLVTLKETEIPGEILDKLSTIINESFRSEKEFKNELVELLGGSLDANYEALILRSSLIYKLRKKIVITLQGTDGNLTGGAFRVAGVFKTSNSLFDGGRVFVRNEDLSKLSGFDNNTAHEIAMMIDEDADPKEVAEKIQLNHPDLKVRTWKEIQPDVGMIDELMQVYLLVIIIIILLALGFGIVNTMLMVVLERVKELGMLMAIGMNRRKVFSMIMLESIFLCITGGIVGMIIGKAVIMYLGATGMDLTAYAEGLEAMGYDAIMYPDIGFGFYIQVTILVILTGILSSIYPAIKALKLNPADAIRTD